MDRTLRNTIAVLVLTAFTALAIFGTVQLTARVTGIEAVSSANAATVQSGYGGDAQQYGSNGYGSDRYGSSSGSSGQVMTCPATGCTASYCHAAH